MLKLLATVFAAVTLISCAWRGQATTPSAAAAGELQVVPVAKAARTNLSSAITLTGEFLPYQEVDVMAKVAGYIKTISVDIGDRVHTGQLLATLEIPEMQNDLAKAEASVEQTEAELGVARDEVQRATSVRMPVDLFPAMNIPVVAVATFYSGMPPEQIEGNITYHLERFFTLASGIDHMESRSLAGVSLIKVYFQPGTNPDSAVTTIASLAMAEISHLPPGTLPPFVLKMDASSLPVCLVTLKGDDLSETQLKDLAQNVVRNQLAGVPGAAVPQPFGGRWREIMLYADPYKLEARQLSLMDVVRAMNESNLILPAGDVQIGRYDYNIYANSQVQGRRHQQVPLKLVGRQSGARLRYRRRQGRLRCNTTRARGWPALGLPAGAEAGRRFQHHRGRRWRARETGNCSTSPTLVTIAWSSINRSS
jgi:hypothetical protein